jgi:hypothetical protein
MKHLSLFLLLLSLLNLGVACNRTNEGTGDGALEEMEHEADEAGDKMEDSVERTGDKIENAAE